jgi:hypothetical protein
MSEKRPSSARKIAFSQAFLEFFGLAARHGKSSRLVRISRYVSAPRKKHAADGPEQSFPRQNVLVQCNLAQGKTFNSLFLAEKKLTEWLKEPVACGLLRCCFRIASRKLQYCPILGTSWQSKKIDRWYQQRGRIHVERHEDHLTVTTLHQES